MAQKDIRTRIVEAETLGSKWLADGNEHAEAGRTEKAERCYDKAQFWLDRYNRLAGNR